MALLQERADEALMLAYQQGDPAAFDVLLKRHQRPVYNFLLRNVGNPALAEDLLQEVFLRVIRSAASYKKEAKFTTWIYTIARNAKDRSEFAGSCFSPDGSVLFVNMQFLGLTLAIKGPWRS